MSIDAMKQALEALENYCTPYRDGSHPADDVITALRQAIEQAEKQEPVCEYCGGDRFTAPPQRQPLTEEQLDRIYAAHHDQHGYALNWGWEYERAIERAHGIGGEV